MSDEHKAPQGSGSHGRYTDWLFSPNEWEWNPSTNWLFVDVRPRVPFAPEPQRDTSNRELTP